LTTLTILFFFFFSPLHRLGEQSSFPEEELQLIYKKFHAVRFYTYSESGQKDNSYLDFLSFYNFLTQVTKWAGLEEDNHKMTKSEKELARLMKVTHGSNILRKFFDFTDVEKKGRITMEQLTLGLQKLIKGDLLSRIDSAYHLSPSP